MTLLLRPQFEDDEGPQGYLFRLAEANGLGMNALCDIGLHFDLDAFIRLGYFPGSDLDGTAAKTAGAVEKRLVKQPFSWNRKVARFCPECLRDQGYWKYSWEMLYCDACPMHQVWLIDRCQFCKQILTWRRSELLRCSCGALLDTHGAASCPKSLSRLSLAMSHCVVPSEQGAPITLLGDISLAQLQRLIRMLGAYGDMGFGHKPQKVSGAQYMDISWRLTSLAAEIIAQWPESFFTLLHSLEQRQPVSGGAGRMSQVFGHFYALLYRGFPEPEFAFLRCAFEEFVSENWRGSFASRNRRLFDRLPKQMAWIPAKHACQILGLSRHRLDELVRCGKLNAEVRFSPTGRRFLMFRRAEVEVEALHKDAEIDLSTAAKLLGLKKKRMASLIPILVPEASRPSLPGRPWRISRKSIDSITSFIQALPPMDVLPDGVVPFTHVLRAWPWSDRAVADFLLDVLNDEVVPVGRLSGSGVSCLLFQRKHLQEWHRLNQHAELSSFSVPEVVERLSIKQEVAYFLVRKGLLKSETFGKGCHAEARISYQCLAAFEAAYVFGRDLAKDIGTSSRSLANKLSVLGIKPTCGPGTDTCRQLIYQRGTELDRAFGLISTHGVRRRKGTDPLISSRSRYPLPTMESIQNDKANNLH